MGKYSVSIPDEMVAAAAIVLAGEGEPPIEGASKIVQAVFADFLLRNKAHKMCAVEDLLRVGVVDRFESMLLELVEP